MKKAKNTAIKDLPTRLMLIGINCLGYGILPKYPLIDPSISAGTKAYLCYLFSNSNGVEIKNKKFNPGETVEFAVYPKIKTIKEDLGVKSDETIRKYQEEAVEAGYLRIERAFLPNASRNRFPQNIYYLQDKPKFADNADDSKINDFHKKCRENIAKHGLFSSIGKHIPKNERQGLGYGKIQRAVMKDTRIPRNSKAFFGFTAAHANTVKDLKNMGNAAQLELKNILLGLGICENTYRKALRPLCEANYVTAYQPHNGTHFEHCYYVLNDKPDVSKASKKCILVRNKDIVTVHTPVSPKNGRKFSQKFRKDFKKYKAPEKFSSPIEQVKAEIQRDRQIPYKYNQNRTLAETAAHYLTRYDITKDYENLDLSKDRAESLFNHALTDLICLKDTAKIGKRPAVTYAKIIERLKPFMEFSSRFGADIGTLYDSVCEGFAEYCDDHDVQNHLALMKTFIVNAIFDGKAAVVAKALD